MQRVPRTAGRGGRELNIILQFLFETGDKTPSHHQTFVVVNNAADFCYDTLSDSISSYMDSDYNEDNEYDDIITDIMNASGLKWAFMDMPIPESKAIYTYWI
jgi:hypothetical protein